MAYVVPQLKVFQEFTATPAAITSPLRAFIMGPHFHLVKYADGEGRLGQYDPSTDEAHAWPDRPAGAVVDQGFTQVNVKNAALRYYSNTAGSLTDEIKAVLGYVNRVRAEAVNFIDSPTDPATYPRSVNLPVRDVAVGDLARVYANVGGDTVELWSRIMDILPDLAETTVAASADPDASNYDTLADTFAGSEIAGSPSRLASTGVYTAGSYDGRVDGYPVEVYTVEVTVASSGGTGGLANVTSASGTDDASDVALEAINQAIGSRGLEFDWGGSGEWEVGDTFRISIQQDYDPPAVAGAGEFDNDADITYILKVTTGGDSGTARITVSSLNGADSSGSHLVTSGTPIAIGSKGVTVTFSSFVDGLYKGAQWYLACTGRTEQGYKTLVLADSLPTELRAVDSHSAGPGSSSSTIVAADLNLQLFVKQDILLPRENFPSAPDTNWEQEETQIVLQSGAQIFDSAFVDTLGDLVPLTLDADSAGLYSIVYVTYRALLQTFATGINSLDAIGDVEDTLGEISVDNPLALGVWYALRNSNGTDVKFMAVPTNDLTGYTDVLDKATGRRDLYTLVPMTKDATIQSAIAAHVQERSSELNNQWRIAFFNGASSSIYPLVDVDAVYPPGGTTAYDEDDLLATMIDDPDASGTQYTLLEWDAGVLPAGGGFVDMGVRAGDLVRINYAGDGFGGTTYDEFVVDEVVSNQRIRTLTGPASPISPARKFSIQRSQSKVEEATAYGAKAAVFASRRIYYVWPDVIEDASGVQIDGFYICAAIAGLISGVVPQRGLTRTAIEGFSAVTRTTDYFSESHLNTMAELGVWIIVQDPDSLSIITRHQLSTDMTDLKTRELSINKNLDSISLTFFNQLEPYIGRANVTERLLLQLRRQIMGTSDYLKAFGATPELGGQIITVEILELRQDTLNLDHVIAKLSLVLPPPLNVIELYLSI